MIESLGFYFNPIHMMLGSIVAKNKKNELIALFGAASIYVHGAQQYCYRVSY